MPSNVSSLRRPALLAATLLVVGFQATAFAVGQAESKAKPAGDAPVVITTVGSGRATAYAEASKIVTLGNTTHVAWLDADKTGFWVRARSLDRRSGKWSEPVLIGAGQDNHGGPALIADSKGYLHIIYYPHHQPMRYRRSLRPNDSSEWGPEIQFGENLSYPVVVCSKDDTLILTARRKANLEDDRYHMELWRMPAGGSWVRDRVVLRSRHPGYTHFQDSLAWGPDFRTLHLSCRIYETNPVEGGKPIQTIGYLRSPDEGRTWTKADGTPVNLPATADTVDVLVRGGADAGPLLYAGALAVNRAGVPHLVHSERRGIEGKAFLATPDEAGKWTRRELNQYLPEGWRTHDVVFTTGGGISFSESGRATIVAIAVKVKEDDRLLDWAHPSSEIVRFWSDDGCRTFKSEILKPIDAGRAQWLPNIERATGHNRIPEEPGIIYTIGPAGSGLHDLEVFNEVWWRPAN
jgi:hypothetical protein